MTESKELQKAKAESRKMIEDKRVKVRQFVKGRPRGRPIKHSGTYYTRPVLITDRLMLKIRRNRLPGEPNGSVLERLVGIAEQKNPVAPIEAYEPEPEPPYMKDDDLFNRMWDFYDMSKQVKKQDE